MNKKEIGIRSLVALIGVAILALGATTLRMGKVGLDPYTSTNIALGGKLGLSLGVYQLMVNIIILVLIFIFEKKYIGIGTVINMVLAGFFIDFYTEIFTSLNLVAHNILMQLLFLVIGILLFSFGASLYMGAELGNAPYDAIAPVIVDKTGAPYRVIRVIQDVTFSVVAFVFGGPIGIGTFISAFLTGPFISFFDQKITHPIVNSLTKK
ncbi:YczE/YyaS/YitT family protein [Enterococcus sp. SMC-9]|uniref:YczE/YyaS/YitT family protein n=1 Tax=Enterococcus sp. SMC-9 TaxID=2862343 RepID=UPI001E62560B|nr:hypothetical protein [Enterococcus sp. SMC-9]MCD1024597.1 hypothetical protein [Enterococcus sp. SMC-9]